MSAREGGRQNAARALLWALLAVALARLWVMPMFSSFWVDEMGTAFVVRHGRDDASLRVAPQVPESVYYALPALSRKLGERSEFAWRLPSLLAMLGALAVIGRLAARLIHRDAAWFAVFACLTLRGFNYQAADARPYGLGTFLAAAALLFLIRSIDSWRPADAAGFLLCAALLWRVQLVYWPMYAVFAFYAAVRLRGQGRAAWLRAGLGAVSVAAALVPVLLTALAIFREAGAHVVVAPPSLLDFARSLKLGLVVGCGAGAWLAWRITPKRAAAASFAPGALIVILGWWLCEPLGLFAFSHLTGASVWVPRYLSLSLAGCALAATAAASRFLSAGQWRLAAAVLGFAALLLNGQWGAWWPPHHNSDWRAAAKSAEAWGGPGTPVICPSPFIEARPPEWTPDYPLPGFLYSHLEFYPPGGRPYLFPFEASEAAKRYAEELARGPLLRAGRFVIYGGAGQAGYWRDWFGGRVEFAGWKIDRPGPFRDVEVYGFYR